MRDHTVQWMYKGGAWFRFTTLGHQAIAWSKVLKSHGYLYVSVTKPREDSEVSV